MTMAEEENKSPKNRGATRHCCYGLCKSDTRYKDRDHMQGVGWIPFPKPTVDEDKCKRWILACGRPSEDFNVNKVKKWTYICTKHFVGGLGSTKDNPDPIPATFSPLQVAKLSRKRKPPTTRVTPLSKRTLIDPTSSTCSVHADVHDDIDGITPLQPSSDHSQIREQADTAPAATSIDIGVNTENSNSNQGTQTTFACGDILMNKINNFVLMRNKLKVTGEGQSKAVKDSNVSSFSFGQISKDEKMFKFYTGLSVLQFQHLFSSFGSETSNLNYWRGGRTTEKVSGKPRPTERKLSPENELFLTMVRLRQAFPNKDLAYRFGLSESTVSNIINTWIQYIFRKTEGLRAMQLPQRHLISKHLPPCYSSFKNVRIIIDCFEMRVQSSGDFAEQGNMYSSYKHHTTLKCLIGISPSGGIAFLSDTYEGSISDKEIVVQSGLAEVLDPGDLVIADRGFLIKDILQKYKIELNIPPFLGGREKLTAKEEILTKRIARVRIHVERAIERMKKYKIISQIVPLNLKPVVTQIVHIIGFLVNYQDPLVS